MVDIVDAFVVSLGLDPTQYNQEVKKFREDRKKLAEENIKYGQEEQDTQKRSADGVRRLRNETAGFLLMLAGANSLKQFVGNMLSGDAATGRFAANIGMATERVAVWEGALERVGGKAEDAQSSLRALSSIFNDWKLTGNRDKSGDLAFFGLSQPDLEDPESALLQMASAGEGLQGKRRGEFLMRLNRLGINDATVTLISKGRVELERLLEEVRKNGVATDKSARDAQDFDNALAKITQTIKGEARPYVSQLAAALSKLADNGNATESVLLAIGVAAGIALGPVRLMVAAVAALTIAFVDLNKAGAAWQIIGLRAQKAYHELRAAGEADSPERKLYHLQAAADAADSISRLANSANATPNYGAATQWSGGLGLSARPGAVPSHLLASGAVAGSWGAGGTADAVWQSIIQQESGGQAGVIGPMTRWGTAKGKTQMLDSTARAMARKLGVAYRPDLMTGTTAEAAAYQERLGRAYFDEGLAASGGDLAGAAAYYHGGPNQRMHGAKTSAYVRQVMGRAGQGTRGGTTTQSNSTTVGQVNIYTQATDAAGIVRDFSAEMNRRGLVMQSAQGLRP